MPIPASRPTTAAGGIYRATVLNNQDPEQRGRVQVMVPAIAGQGSGWAAGCFPPGGPSAAPRVGDMVWVMFENGDPAWPVWLGVCG
jgi:uncharacterized protein involved in type VI secretion and phage assembly